MKINKLLIFSVLMALLAGILITCSSETESAYSSEAVLLSLRIGDEQATVPQAITAVQWDSETFSLAGADRGRVSFNNAEAATNLRIRAIVKGNSQVEWGSGKLGVRPDRFFNINKPIDSIDEGDHIYIKVTADDNETVSYYRVYARYKFNVASLNKISIKSREGKMDVHSFEGGDTPENATTSFISITTDEAKQPLVEALPYDESATVKYALIGKDDPAPIDDPDTGETDFIYNSSEPLSKIITDQGWLYVKVIAENTIAHSYFKFRVDVGRIADIKTLTFKGEKATDRFIIYGKGLPKPLYKDVASGDYSTADQPGAGFSFDIELEDSEATVTYTKVNNSITIDPAYPAPGSVEDKIKFNDGDALAIKVAAVNGDVVLHYKIKVSLVPANFKEHPKSAWYMKDAPAKPLTVELDRAGSFTYQWYEADSWYGIYGRQGTALDEKNNVSYVNGGPDMYYYLVQPDDIMDALHQPKMRQPAGADEASAWKIDGATTNTYTPPTDWEKVEVIIEKQGGTNANYPYKPNVNYPAENGGPGPRKVNFTAGSTSESRYYWCVVTDTNTGLTVASKRALILTETEKKMDHFIFELSTLPAKNIIPFEKSGTDISYGYKIQFPSNYFPAGFDPKKYEICIAIAQYFLPDGRAWTQNWTHGNLFFGYNDNSLTWWHNNLGANSGSIPLQAPHSSKGGLERKPDWVGFTAAGDVGRGLPPLDSATGRLPVGYKPAGYPEGQAQGYFCGFIELLELRFSTPPPTN